VLLERLTLANFRNYAAADWTPAPGLNLLIGANAQGKSNLLEAIAMLATGKSFRTSRDAEVIRFGQPLASVVGTARAGAGRLNLACTVAGTASGTRKTYVINGESVRYARFLGSLKTVTFAPQDLALVWGPPALRRAMVNEALSLAERSYYHELARYRKALLQKGALLRGLAGPAADPGLLDVYDATLVASGSALMLRRRHYLSALGAAATSLYAQWISGERLGVTYAPDVAVEAPTPDAVEAEFARRLSEQRPVELARKRCLVGPHRDDVNLELDGKPLARFGSQGQHRAAVLALKLAEYAVLRDLGGEAPLLLLDDVLSELDAERSDAFVASLGATIEQAFITSAHRPQDARWEAAAWRVRGAAVTPC
jgi:DNA replication and repair protein RecF